MLTQFLQERVSFRQVLAVGAFAFEQVRNGIEPEAVDALVEPEIDHAEHRSADQRMIEVQVRLMREEAVPVVGFGDGIPGPVRSLRIVEDDASFFVLVGCVAPDVELALPAPRLRRVELAETRDAGRMCG